jgi:multiple sugar transport system ATP-binding protein
MASVALGGVSKRFGDTVAVERVDLEVADGEFLVLLGPSGCGKTTLLRMIAGLEVASDGAILIGDRDVTRVHPADRDVAMVFQSYALYPHMTVHKNLAYGLKRRGMPKREIEERVAETARLLELEPLLARLPAQLSGGQRQRVALGRAIVRHPAVFLLDEPLSNLDAQLRVQTRNELIRLRRRLAVTMIYVTHDQVEAMTMGDRIVVMNGGRVQQVGTPLELFDRPNNRFVATFLGTPQMNEIEGRLSRASRGVEFVAEVIQFELPISAGSEDPRDVVLGIRPHHLWAAPEAVPGRVSLGRGIVEFVEHLGNESFAYLTIGGGQTIAAEVEAGSTLALGAALELTTVPERLHFFDLATGDRLDLLQDVGSDNERTPVGAREIHGEGAGSDGDDD